MNRKTLLANAEYSLAQGAYWMELCVVMSFANVFLQNRGYSNAQLGLVLALGNAAAFGLSIVLGGIVDRSEKLDSEKMLWILLALQTLLILSFRLFPGRSFAVSLCYSLYIAVNSCIVPMLTQLSFELSSPACEINYGLGRGVGSLAYALAAAALGVIAERFGTETMIGAGLLLTLCQMLTLFLFTRGRTKTAAAKKTEEKSASMPQFIAENRRFCRMMFGYAVIFFAYRFFDSFLINIVRNVGGGTRDMGNINAFMAVTELPAMFFYTRLSRRFGCSRCVCFGLLCFLGRALAIAWAPTLPLLFAAHLFQGLSYGLLTPALVEYTALVVPKKDAARGQAFSYSVTTLGSIFASLFGGRMFDTLPVRTVLYIGAAITLVGLAFALPAREKNAERV